MIMVRRWGIITVVKYMHRIVAVKTYYILLSNGCIHAYIYIYNYDPGNIIQLIYTTLP